MPLADASYDGWVFPYALEQLVGPGVMQRIYEQGATHSHERDRRGRSGRPGEGLPGVRQARLEPRPGQAELLGVGRVRPGARGRARRRDRPRAGGPGRRRAAGGRPDTTAEAALARVQAPEVRPRHHRGERGGAVRREPSRRCPDEAAQRQRADGGPVEAEGHGVLPRDGRRANRRAGAGGVEHVDIPADGSGQADQGRGTNLGCSRYVGSVTGAEYYKTQSADTTRVMDGHGSRLPAQLDRGQVGRELELQAGRRHGDLEIQRHEPGLLLQRGSRDVPGPFGRLDGLASGARVEHLPGQAGPRLLRARLEPSGGPRDDHLPGRGTSRQPYGRTSS